MNCEKLKAVEQPQSFIKTPVETIKSYLHEQTKNPYRVINDNCNVIYEPENLTDEYYKLKIIDYRCKTYSLRRDILINDMNNCSILNIEIVKE